MRPLVIFGRGLTLRVNPPVRIEHHADGRLELLAMAHAEHAMQAMFEGLPLLTVHPDGRVDGETRQVSHADGPQTDGWFVQNGKHCAPWSAGLAVEATVDSDEALVFVDLDMDDTLLALIDAGGDRITPAHVQIPGAVLAAEDADGFELHYSYAETDWLVRWRNLSPPGGPLTAKYQVERSGHSAFWAKVEPVLEGLVAPRTDV